MSALPENLWGTTYTPSQQQRRLQQQDMKAQVDLRERGEVELCTGVHGMLPLLLLNGECS
jgi:hypothetical protein